MTDEELSKLIREFLPYPSKDQHYGLRSFAKLVAEAEREACAKVAESYEPRCDSCPSGVANAIRARGK